MIKKYIMTWKELQDRCFELSDRMKRDLNKKPHYGGWNLKIYGVPKGGMILSSIFTNMGWEIVFNPFEADVIVDDVQESGRTKDKYEKLYNKPFYPLIDKKNNILHKEMGWIVFPFENDKIDDSDDNLIRVLQFNEIPETELDKLKLVVNKFLDNYI